MMNVQEKIIILKSSVLYAPRPTDPTPFTRGRHLECKTVHVKNVPEKATVEMMKEIFEMCGEIHTIRMIAKHEYHVTFASEAFVDPALCFSGYRMIIENKIDPSYTGRLHVDYATNEHDEYEFEERQRAMQYEAKYKQREEVEYYEVPTPYPVAPYSKRKGTKLSYDLLNWKIFQQSALNLIASLKNGECTIQNAGYFFSLIQETYRQLREEKLKYKDELNEEVLIKVMQGILPQFNNVEKLLNIALLPQVCDNFTKVQRRYIEMWKDITEEVKHAYVEEVLKYRIEVEMDLSEGEEEIYEGAAKETPDISDQKEELNEDINELKDDNDVLQFQLKAAGNKMMVLQI